MAQRHDNPKSLPTRRSFLRGVLGTVLFRSALSSALLVAHRPAYAQYAEAFAVASGAMNLVLSFAKRGNGMGAMLGAIRELQQLTIQQLFVIQTQLGSIIATIDRLPDEMRRNSREQYQYELTTELIGSANRYQTYLRAAQATPEIFERDEVKQQLQLILNTVQGHRSTLAASDYGRSPETCLLVPVACALEIAALSRLNFHKNVIIAVLGDYRKWLRDMLSDSPGAIPTVQKEAMAKHDAALSEAQKLPRWRVAMAEEKWKKTWGDYFDLENFKLGRNPSDYGAYGDDSCYVFSKAPQSFLAPRGTVGAGRNTAVYAAARGYPASTLTIASTVSQSENEFGVRLLEYKRGLRVFGSVKRVGNTITEDGWLPTEDDPCYMESTPNLPATVDDMIKAVDESDSWKIEKDGAERTSFLAKLVSANEQRMRIGLCVRATTLALEADARIREQLELLKGQPA